MSRFNWACPTCGAATHSKEALVRSSEKSCSCDSALWVASDMPPCVGKLQEEIAALRKTIAEAVPTLDQFVSEVAHAQASGSSWYTRGAAGLYGHIAMWRGKAAVALAALREAGYLGGGDE